MLMETKAARADGRQPLSYFDISKDDFMPTWLTPDAVGGVATRITKEFKLATNLNNKSPSIIAKGYKAPQP